MGWYGQILGGPRPVGEDAQSISVLAFIVGNLASFFFGVFACCFPNCFIPSFWGGIYTRAGVYSLSVRP